MAALGRAAWLVSAALAGGAAAARPLEADVQVPLGGACRFERPELLQLLQISRRLYDDGGFDYDAAFVVANLLAVSDHIRQMCPAAVLQSLLLKVEESMVRDPGSYETIMAAYTHIMQDSLEQGSLNQVDLKVWPLAKGLLRVRDMWLDLKEKRGATSAMVMNFCQTADRFGTEHVFEWLSLPPFGSSADAERHGGAEMGLLNETDLYIYLVDKPKCKWPGDALKDRLLRAVRSVNLVPYRGGPSREEQSAYFKFLADHYESLPDFTIFVHPDADEHQGAEFLSLRRALKLIRTGSALAHKVIGYYPVAQQVVVEPRRTWGSRWVWDWVRFWNALYDRPWKSLGMPAPRCKWESHPGKFILGLAPGTRERMSRSEAKAACVQAGDQCRGVVCGTPRDSEETPEYEDPDMPPLFERPSWVGTCSARAGDGQLYESETETSYVKTCSGEPGGSGFEDAVADGEAQLEKTSTHYEAHAGKFLPDYADGDDAARSLEAARERCNALGAKCAGFTCDGKQTECTVRAAPTPTDSPFGEVSHVRAIGPAKSWPRQPTPPRGEGPFQCYTGSQSVVHKDRILAWSREALRAMSVDGEFCSAYSGLFEAVWHAMFGEPLSQWPREKDPRLPLSLKWGLPTWYSMGDEGVI